MQDFINKQFFYLYTFMLTFAMLLYGLIGFQSIDEICGFVILLMFLYQTFSSKDWNISKGFIITLLIFIFYLFYSIYIGSNSKKAILVDFIIQLKPYIAFFCTYQLMPIFSESQKKILNQYSLLCWFLFLPIGIIGLINFDIFKPIMGHASNYAAAITALSLTYLFTGKFTKKEKFIFICMLAIGLTSGRSKFYGFFIFTLFVTFFSDNIQNLKFNLKNTIIMLAMLFAILFVAKEKIDFYFVQGFSSETSENDYVARFALYATSLLIFTDYFPFGSGFASFATHASGAYYSPIYKEYGINGIWGLSKDYPFFVSDTYYPSLAQFGVIGLCLFVIFWLYLCKKAYSNFRVSKNTIYPAIIIIISGYFAIENIADATFTSHRGIFFMMLLGLVFSNMKYNTSKKN